MSQVSKAPRSRRLNLRKVLLLAIVVVIVVPGVVVMKMYRERQSRGTLLAEARRRIDRKQPHLALGYLSRYLELNPGDVDALDLKARILSENAQNEPQALEAIRVHNQVLGRDSGRQDTRRRLVKLTLKVHGRARAAETLARELIKRGAVDAEAHRLLAHALETIAADGNAAALAEAAREHEVAEQLEPGDVEDSERLALLYTERFKDPKRAVHVLDQLVEAGRGSPRKLALAHLARYRYFTARNQADQAAIEIDHAVGADPESFEVRLAAAESAIRRGDTATAQEHLRKITPSAQNGLQVKLIEGLIELNEQRPDDAIESWRAGLLLTGGHNVDLTWRLAHILLELGRTREAEPLISQYRRLVGGDEPGPRYRYLHGFALLKMNRFAEAITTLDGVRFQIEKQLQPHLYYLLGECYEATRDLPKALEAYRLSAGASRRWNAPWLAIARLQVGEHPTEAVATLEQGLALMPGDTRLLAALAQIYWRQQVQLPREKQSWAAFERLMDQAHTIAPDSVELALVRADYLMAIGKSVEALALLETTAKRHPKSVMLWLAWANGLSRMGQSPYAQEVLDRAIATIGNSADLFVTRAAILIGQGHAKTARTSLRNGLDRVSNDQKLILWKALGELAVGQGDQVGARQAYHAWASLRPDDPEPRMTLVDLAVAAGDEVLLRAEVDALKDVGGPTGPYWRLARVEELLRGRPSVPLDADRIDESARLIREIQVNQPQLPLGFLLEGRMQEKRNETVKAIAAYERAIDLKGGPLALNPLVSLLIREGRVNDLERIRVKLANLPPEVERLATIQALKSGDRSRAEQLAAQMVKGDPEGLDARVWQAQVLNALGKPKDAEAALRLLIEQQPQQQGPWVQLLMLLIGQKQIKEATTLVEQIRNRVKTDRPELLWAQCYRVVGDLRRADECYQIALRRWPDDLGVRIAAIRFYEESDRKIEAEASLRSLLKSDPALGWATRKLAILRSGHAGDHAAWEEALSLIGPGAKPDDLPDDVLTRATVYAQSPEPRHHQQALKILGELVAEQPRSSAAQLLMTRLLLAKGQREQARTHAARAASPNDATPEAMLLYAGILLRVGDLDEAERQHARLVAIDPEGLPVTELHARLLAARGKGAEASTCLESAFASRINTPEGLAVAGKMIRLLLELNRADAAERVARQLAGLGSRGACLLAEFLATHGQADEAAALLRDVAKGGGSRDAGGTALTLASTTGADPRWLALADSYLATARGAQPDVFDLLQKQAFLRHLQHRHEEELKLYDAMLAHPGPSSFMFLNNMAWTLSESMNRPEDGLKRANEAVERVGREPHLLDTRGVIEIRLGRLDEAIEDLKEAATALPVGPVDFHLARAYRAKGRTQDFLNHRDRARQAGLRPEQLQESERGDWAAILND